MLFVLTDRLRSMPGLQDQSASRELHVNHALAEGFGHVLHGYDPE